MATPVVHPGSILRREIETREVSATRLALDLGIPQSRIAEILHGRRSISPDTAYRLGLYLGTGGALWLNLQAQHDLALLERERGSVIQHEIRIPPPETHNHGHHAHIY